MQLKLYSSFFEQVFERVIGIAAEGYEALYFSIHQHLGAQYAWWMCGIDRGVCEVNAMKGCLYDYVLFGVNSPAYFLPGSRFDIHLIPEAAKFKAIFDPGGSAVIAGG